MAKNKKIQSTSEENKKRLQEISEIQLGTLSDDDILRFLAERKRISDLEREYERIQKEEEERLERERKEAALEEQEKKKALIVGKIKELNKSISPEKQNDDLLSLIAERKELEKELEVLGGEVLPQEEKTFSAPVPPVQISEDIPSEKEVSVPKIEVQKTVPKEEDAPEREVKETPVEVRSQEPKEYVEEEYGKEKIQDDGIETGSEFHRYLDQLKSNLGSLGELLQNMPLGAKKNKAFMLAVAKIDPAYAMHFADKESLKRDEDFNLRVAALGNPRNSGNALAEMLPEFRTSKVLLAAVKQDYRNIKFIQPNMADYDEIMERAKKGALEKVKSLKEATDITLLVPRILQQDKQFMLQIKEIIDPKKER